MSTPADAISIRPAMPADVPLVLSFIRELALYERLAAQVSASEADLATALFGPRPYAEVVFACLEGAPVGFALFFHNFSPFLGKPGIYLEDLFVRPQARGSTGPCLTGTRRRSASTAASVPWYSMNGRPIA